MAGPVFSIPYDFDMSGIINTRYSTVNENLPIPGVTARLYRGRCVPEEQLQRTLQAFRDRREAIYGLYRDQEGLDERVLDRSLDYLDDFYEIVNDDGKVQGDIVRDCRRI
jgi:hypothetical protein